MKVLENFADWREEISVQVLAPNRLRVGRKTAALGLLWQPVRPQTSLRDQAGMAGGQGSEFDLAASFGAKQLGFGMKSEGLGAGMLAGASLFDADSLGGTWLATFPLDTGRLWWIVAMRDAKIYEDRVLFDAAEARATLVKSLDAPGWGKIIAPSEWNIEKSEQLGLSKIISFRHASRLRLVDRRFQTGTTMLLAAIVAVALAYAWLQLSRYLAEERLRKEAFERARKSTSSELPWNSVPKIADFVFACMQEMDSVAVIPPGWTLQPLTCRWSGEEAWLDAGWRRKSGRIPYLREMVENRTGLRVGLSGNGESASLSMPIDAPVETANADPWPARRIETVLRERFQTLGLDLKMTARVVPPSISGSGDGSMRVHNRHDIGIATSVAINEYARLLSDVPALVPESLVFRPQTRVWLLNARAYHAELRPTGIQ